jgi:hypothetical protein
VPPLSCEQRVLKAVENLGDLDPFPPPTAAAVNTHTLIIKKCAGTYGAGTYSRRCCRECADTDVDRSDRPARPAGVKTVSVDAISDELALALAGRRKNVLRQRNRIPESRQMLPRAWCGVDKSFQLSHEVGGRLALALTLGRSPRRLSPDAGPAHLTSPVSSGFLDQTLLTKLQKISSGRVCEKCARTPPAVYVDHWRPQECSSEGVPHVMSVRRLPETTGVLDQNLGTERGSGFGPPAATRA